MPPKIIKEPSEFERYQLAVAATTFPLARLIQSGEIDPENITEPQFLKAIKKLGKSHDTAYEVYTDRTDEEIELITHCIKKGEEKSAVVLLFTLLEGEINTLIRIHLRIKGFSSNSITDALRGADFETKLDVMLPLLEVTVPPRIRNAALQCKAIRNIIIHNKASPSLMSLDGDKPSDTEIASERAVKFFSENPVIRLRKDLKSFINDGIYESWAVQWASHLLATHYAPKGS